MNFREPTTIYGGQRMTHAIETLECSPIALNVPNAGWCVGSWVQGQATGVVKTIYVNEHYAISHRRTFRQSPLVWISEAGQPELNTIEMDNFVNHLGLASENTVRTKRKGAYVKKYAEWKNGGAWQVTGAIELGSQIITISASGVALLVKKFQYTIQKYTTSDTVEVFKALARYDGAIYEFFEQYTSQKWIDVVIQKNAASMVTSNTTNPAFVRKKIDSLEKHINRTFEPEELATCVDVLAMVLEDRNIAETKLNDWLAYGVPLGVS